MKLLGARRRKALRWSVYIVTLLIIIAIPVSIWIEPTITYEGPTKELGGTHREWEFNLAKTRFTITMHAFASGGHFSQHPISNARIRSTTHRELFPPMQSRWWERPRFTRWGGSDGPGTRIELPMAYPAATLLACSLWVFIVNRRTVRVGHCPNCNYNLAGLESATCPECGREDAP